MAQTGVKPTDSLALADIAAECGDHRGAVWCAECCLDVDEHGNTEKEMEFCAAPDCGCPERRLCMARNQG